MKPRGGFSAAGSIPKKEEGCMFKREKPLFQEFPVEPYLYG